jgi:ferric-dicitrate binding protein FerR (iron transport regulator)
MAKAKRIADLTFRQLKGTLTTEEAEELRRWIEASDVNGAFMETRADRNALADDLEALIDMDREAIQRKCDERCPEAAIETAPVRQVSRYWIPAAAVITAAAVGGVISFRHPKTASQQDAARLLADQQLAGMMKVPDGPRLTLHGGMTVDLDTVQGTLNADYWNVYRKDHRLVYELKNEEKRPRTLYYHTLSVPYGQKWQVSLPDSSVIQLNTGSAVTYPVPWTGAILPSRNLALRGEAQFEVARDVKTPFVVHTRQADVKSLSTVFVVRDNVVKNDFLAFAVKGNIQVRAGLDIRQLREGEAAILDQARVRLVSSDSFDIAKATEWMDDFFHLSSLDVRQSMEVLKKYYGMDTVIYGQGVNLGEVGYVSRGTISKLSHLENLLPMLEKEHLYFHIKGKAIIVTSSKP